MHVLRWLLRWPEHYWGPQDQTTQKTYVRESRIVESAGCARRQSNHHRAPHNEKTQNKAYTRITGATTCANHRGIDFGGEARQQVEHPQAPKDPTTQNKARTRITEARFWRAGNQIIILLLLLLLLRLLRLLLLLLLLLLPLLPLGPVFYGVLIPIRGGGVGLSGCQGVDEM